MSTLLVPLLFGLFGAACVFATLVGLPGTWALLGGALLVEALDFLWLGAGVSTFGWPWLVGAVLLALLGEGLEFVSGLLGARAGGATRRGMIGAVLGGLLGALGGTALVPVVGTLVGGALGTFGGALLGETTGPAARSRREALVPALSATVAKVMGSIAKAGIAVGLVVLLLIPVLL